HQHDNGDKCGDDYGDDNSHAYPSGGRRPDAAVHLVSGTSYPSTGCSKRTRRAFSPQTSTAPPARFEGTHVSPVLVTGHGATRRGADRSISSSGRRAVSTSPGERRRLAQARGMRGSAREQAR